MKAKIDWEKAKDFSVDYLRLYRALQNIAPREAFMILKNYIADFLHFHYPKAEHNQRLEAFCESVRVTLKNKEEDGGTS